MKHNFTFKTSKTLYLHIAAVILFVVTLAGCKKKDVQPGSAYIQVTNASESSLPQDFYVDGNKATVTPLDYGQSTAGYLTFSATEHQAQFKTATTSAINASFAMAPETGNYYSIYFLGSQTAAYQDDPTPAQTGKAKVRFINLSSAITGSVDFGIAGGARLSTGLIQYLASDYYQVDPSTKFVVYGAGAATVLLDVPITLQAGKTYTIYATGSTNVTYKFVVSQ